MDVVHTDGYMENIAIVITVMYKQQTNHCAYLLTSSSFYMEMTPKQIAQTKQLLTHQTHLPKQEALRYTNHLTQAYNKIQTHVHQTVYYTMIIVIANLGTSQMDYPVFHYLNCWSYQKILY